MKAIDVIATAMRYINQGEDPRGSNWNDDPKSLVRRSLLLVGINKPASWCAAALSLWIIEANGGTKPSWFSPSASAMRMRTYNIQHLLKDKSKAQPGDLYFIDHGKGLGHCGVVKSWPTLDSEWSSLRFWDVSGNSNDDSQTRQGWKVASNLRTLDDPRLSIIHPPYEVTP